MAAISARMEHVGSLLRPDYLHRARDEHAAGRLGEAEFKSVEDRAVRDVLALQEQAGCPIVTDGELRRDSFQSQLVAACEGFSGVDMNAWLHGHWHSEVFGDETVSRPESLAVTEPLRRRRNLAAEEFAVLRACSAQTGKVTLPSPSLFANLWAPERSRDAYRTLDDFLVDVLGVLVEEVRELLRLVCTYIQLDAPHYPLLVDPTWREFYTARGWSVDRWLSYGIELDNAVIDAGRPATFGFHLCRGNQHSRWLVSGGYEAIAAPIFSRVRADRLLLEYDDERSGDFEPLRLLPADTVAVLGLVTTKTPRAETVEELTGRVRAAAEFAGYDRLAISPQCGFATSVEGNALTEDDERRKLETLVASAREAFG
jgi:5-methyltetrahydropteroyltriglutamate--homocysteine methyltransferase